MKRVGLCCCRREGFPRTGSQTLRRRLNVHAESTCWFGLPNTQVPAHSYSRWLVKGVRARSYPFHDDASERVADEDEWSLHRIFKLISLFQRSPLMDSMLPEPGLPRGLPRVRPLKSAHAVEYGLTRSCPVLPSPWRCNHKSGFESFSGSMVEGLDL